MKHKLHKMVAMLVASIFAVSAFAQEVKTDYTDAITNAAVTSKDGWNAEGASFGTPEKKDEVVKYGSGKLVDFNQTITIPAGQYKMTAKAAYRYGGGNDAEKVEYDAIQSGVDTHLAKFYAETATYKYETNVMNRWEGASKTDYVNGNGSVQINGLYVPNSSAAVKAWFDAGQYVNELVFNVQAEGEVKIGILKTVNPEGIGGDYTNIGAWTLTRLGDAQADPEVDQPEPEEPEYPIDVTDKVGTSKEAWHTGGGPVNFEGVSMPEHYLGNTTTLGVLMWQDVTGLENGTYTVELWANARYTPGRGFETKAEDGALNFTYLSANNVEISIPVVYNSDANNNTSHVLENVYVTDGTLRIAMSKKAEGSNWHTIQIKSLIYHGLDEAALLAYAKENLQAAIDEANAVEPKKDDFVAVIAAAQTVYDSSKSADEVNAATATLKEATKLAILGNASEENPVLTDFVVNGTFDTNGVTAPWKTTTGAQNQTTATNQQGAFTGNFFENWNPSAVTGKIYQVIENIPNGVYELSICAFVNNFNASAQFVYANADKVALTAGAPTAYTVRTVVTNNTIEVGFEQTEAVANWMGIDNVSLTYFGPASDSEALKAAKEAFTAAYDEFNAAMTACQATMLKTNFYEVADAADQLNAQLESTTDADALYAMVEQLNEATASLNEINEVYAEYDVFVQLFKAAAEISEPLTTEASELLEYNMYGGAGMQAMSLDALKQAIQQIKADYLAYIVNAKLSEGAKFDVTFLIANAAVASAEGWTNGNTHGGEAYEGAPDRNYLDWCNWSGAVATFNMYQELADMPAGVYTLKAATRSDSRMEGYIYAGDAKAAIHKVGNSGNELGGGWGWTMVENVEVHTGVLTIGFTGTAQENGVWAGADAFELYYVGAVEAATEEQKAEFAEALAAAENHVLGFAKDEYAPYTNVEAVEALLAAKAIDLENASAKGLPILKAALDAAVWTANTGDMSIIYNGDFAVVTPDADYPLGWTRTNAWGQMQTNVTGCDNGTAYYNQPGSMVYGNTGAYLMPLKANATYKLTFKYRSHEEGSNKGVVATVALGENSIEVCKAEENPSKDNWKEGEGEFETTEAGNYILTLANSGNTWMTDVVLVQVAGDDTGISAPAMQNVETIIYDLQGRRVQKMEKGLYIVNGRKVLVK